MAYPLGRTAPLRSAAVALFIVDPDRCSAITAQTVQVLYRLTRAEADLACALAAATPR